MKKSKNDITDIVHGLSGRKIGPANLYETICKKSTGLFWLKCDDKEPITCMKCCSILPRK